MGELARRSNIRQPSLWAIEHQRTRKPKAETLLSIARALGVPLRDILAIRPSRTQLDAIDQLTALFGSLDEPNKTAIIAAAQALLHSQKKN